MKRVCLFLFSGTGMTKYAAGKIKEELEKKHVRMDIFRIEKTRLQNVSFMDYDAVGIAYPVHTPKPPAF